MSDQRCAAKGPPPAVAVTSIPRSKSSRARPATPGGLPIWFKVMLAGMLAFASLPHQAFGYWGSTLGSAPATRPPPKPASASIGSAKSHFRQSAKNKLGMGRLRSGNWMGGSRLGKNGNGSAKPHRAKPMGDNPNDRPKPAGSRLGMSGRSPSRLGQSKSKGGDGTSGGAGAVTSASGGGASGTGGDPIIKSPC